MPNMKLATGVGLSALALTAAIASVDAGEQAQATPAAAAVPYYEPAPDPGPNVPDGFTPIFNGKDLTGWHVSKTNHHGTTPEYRVVNGVIVGTQNPSGKGGILLTDKKYKNVEVYMEVKPDWGCDSGLFLRSNEAGNAYQVTLDYLAGGRMGGIYGEGLKGLTQRGRSEAVARRAQGQRRPLAESVEAGSVEHGARPDRRGRPQHHRLDQRPARQRVRQIRPTTPPTARPTA